ncbi:MAG: DinB family protein [Candidatus Kapabacteria bacterium]|nr:DinB family protein [Candidatus Kapabacteria bacterium]
MDIQRVFLHELADEAAKTRAMIERIPDDKFDWRPHHKSMTLHDLAVHVAEIPEWVAIVMTTDGLDFAVTPYQPKHCTTTADVLALAEKSVAAARRELEAASDEEFSKQWTMQNGEHIISVETKAESFRHCQNQVVHHRAQLGVYLRLLDIPIPGSYGPSANEPNYM